MFKLPQISKLTIESLYPYKQLIEVVKYMTLESKYSIVALTSEVIRHWKDSMIVMFWIQWECILNTTLLLLFIGTRLILRGSYLSASFQDPYQQLGIVFKIFIIFFIIVHVFISQEICINSSNGFYFSKSE